jgi:hypothetical protein
MIDKATGEARMIDLLGELFAYLLELDAVTLGSHRIVMWLLFQTTILCAVFVANFFLHITPNPRLVGVTGVLLAWLATLAVVVFRDRKGPAGRL